MAGAWSPTPSDGTPSLYWSDSRLSWSSAGSAGGGSMALGAERGTTAGLATPTTPSAFPPTYLDNKHGPVQHSTYHAPYPPLAPASQPAVTPPLCAFFSDMFAWLWFDAVTLKSAPTPRFSQFISNVLTTTQVSHSVVILALLFVSRLKSRNSINPLPGSEYRAACVALAIGNKVLDDNTYTAKTWADVSGLELKPLVAGEAEFLQGLNFECHVTARDFDAWVRLLEGISSARAQAASKLGRVVIAPPTPFITKGLFGYEALPASSSAFDESRPSKRSRFEDRPRRSSHEVSTRATATATTTNTPNPSFASFVFPATEPRLPPATAPLPAFASSRSSLSPSARDGKSHGAPSRHMTSLSLPWSRQQQAPSASRPTSSKRSAAEAFAESRPSPLEHASLHQLESSNLTRSYSAGNSPAMPRTVYAPQMTMASHRATDAAGQGVRRPRLSGDSQSLADAASPRYGPYGARPETLGFYSLGAGHQLHQSQPYYVPALPFYAYPQPTPSSAPLPPAAKSRGASITHTSPYAPLHPSHLSTSTSPDLSPRSSRAHVPPQPALSCGPRSSYPFGADLVHASIASYGSALQHPLLQPVPPPATAPYPYGGHNQSFAPAPAQPAVPLLPYTVGAPPVPMWTGSMPGSAPVQFSQYSNAGAPGVLWTGRGRPAASSWRA